MENNNVTLAFFNQLKGQLDSHYSIKPYEFLIGNLDKYLLEKDIAVSSKYTYNKNIKAFSNWVLQKDIKKFEHVTILEYKEYMREVKGYNSTTLNNHIIALKSFFTWCYRKGLLTEDICKNIRLCKKIKGFKKDSLNESQIGKLFKVINEEDISNVRDYAIINLMIRTGIRVGEIVNIDQQDICLKNEGAVLSIQGKGSQHKDEFVMLTKESLEPIQKYIQLKPDEYKKINSPLFCSHSKQNKWERLTTRSISRLSKNKLIEAGLESPKLTAHSLRHTAITLSLMGGASLQSTMQLARHALIETTLIYAHNIDRFGENAPEKKISDLLETMIE